jgi:hypothetical protein
VLRAVLVNGSTKSPAMVQLRKRVEELQEDCQQGCTDSLMHMCSCADLSPQKACDFYKRSFLCSDCGRARVTCYGWVPRHMVQHKECDVIAFLCYKCARASKEPVFCGLEQNLLVRAKCGDPLASVGNFTVWCHR